VKRGELEGRLLILVTLGLTAFGLVMVYSATSAAAAVGGKDPSYYLKRQGIYAAAGLCLLVLASRRDYRKLKHAAPTLMLVSLGLLVAVLGIGEAINGARRWIPLGPAAFQPSELAKVALAVWVSAYLAKRRAPTTMKELARPIGAMTAVTCVLILAEPDLGTAIAIVIMLAGILLVSGTPPRLLATATTLAFSVGLFAIWLEPYRRARVFAFLNPWGDSQGTGFQTVQAMIGLGSGGLFGVGLGQGLQKIFYLPEAHTDMIFAIVGEELGLVGSTAVMAAYALFAYAGLRVALACRDPFGKRLATGLTVLVCGQAAVNLAAVMSLAPLTGIPLPFVSYGGSSLVVLLASVGVLLNIAHGDGIARRAQVPDRSRGNGRTRAAGARGRGGAAVPRRQSDVRRVAGSPRSAARS
jgi:cell division protein FtsW